MKALLTVAKTTLQTAIIYVLDRDVYVTEDIRLIRASGNYPAIGLKDGGTVLQVENGAEIRDELTLQAVCYVKLHKPEASLMGDDAAGETGLLDMATDVIAALDATFSGAFGIAEPVSIGESELLIEENQAIQMLPVTMRYTRWR